MESQRESEHKLDALGSERDPALLPKPIPGGREGDRNPSQVWKNLRAEYTLPRVAPCSHAQGRGNSAVLSGQRAKEAPQGYLWPQRGVTSKKIPTSAPLLIGPPVLGILKLQS